jgi:hypothetical protein
MTDEHQHEATQWKPIFTRLSEYPIPAPCCQQAHEQGYRRGYRHTYWYALWDLGRVVRLSDALWAQLTAFYYGDLAAWVWRGRQGSGSPVRKEGGPRFRSQRAKKAA